MPNGQVAGGYTKKLITTIRKKCKPRTRGKREVWKLIVYHSRGKTSHKGENVPEKKMRQLKRALGLKDRGTRID